MKKFLTFLVVFVAIYLNANSQAPANDSCTTASPISIPAGGTACVIGTTVGATSTVYITPVCGQTNWKKDVWYTFVSTGTTNVISVTPTGSPAAQTLGISVWTGSCDTLYYAPSSCEVSTTTGGSDTVTQVVQPGTVFYVEVSSFGTAGGFQLCINSTTPPGSPGSTCATASRLCSTAPFTLATVPAGGTGFTPACFDPGQPPQAGEWYQFTVGVTGSLSWECTPTTAATTHSHGAGPFYVPGNGVELDWAMFNITNGCPTTNNQTAQEVTCNYNFEGQNSKPIGMSDTSTTPNNTNGYPGPVSFEFAPSVTVTAGQTYAIFINNYTNALPTGWNFNFTGSTFQMAPVDSFTVSPDTICGSTGTVTLTNNSLAAVWQKWSFGDGTTSAAVSPGTHTYNAPGTYFISLQDSSQTGCMGAVSKSVLVSSYPIVTVQNDTICANGTGTLTATSSINGGTYLWSTGATTASITASPTSNTTYTVTFTSSQGCSVSTTGAIIVSSTPTTSVTPASATICPSGSTTLTAGAGTGFVWNTGALTQSITVSPATTTTYTVTVTLAGGCTASGTATVTVNNNSSTSVTPTTSTICPGGVATFTAGAGLSYAWSSGDNTQAITVSPATNTTYTVTVTFAGGCTATGAGSVSIVNNLTTSITPQPATACPGQITTLTAGAANSYLWSTGSTTDTIMVSPSTTTSYQVTVTSGTCTASATATVNVSPFTISISPAVTNLCGGNNVVLTCSYTNTNTHGYFWSNSGLGNSQGVTAGPLVSTTYSVTTSDANGCSASATAVVNVDSVVLSISPTAPGVCSGRGTTLTATATGNATYKWNNNVFTDTNTVSPTSTTQYNVTATDTSGCTATDSVNVTLAIAPVASFTFNPAVCIDQPDTITFTGSASSAATYIWGFSGGNASGTGQGPYVVSWSSAGPEVVSLSINDNGCQATPDSQTVSVNSKPASEAGADTTFCSGAIVNIGTTSTAGYTYLWNPAAGLSSATVSNPAVTLSNTTANIDIQKFVVTTSNNGCTSMDSVTLTIYPIPVPQFNDHAPQCLPGNSFNFIAQGSFLPSATFAWTFGPNSNPDSSVAQNPTVTYSVAETASVSLTISQLGCVGNTYTDAVIIYPVPVASFHPDTTLGCQNLNVCFTDSSTSVGATTYLWNFGDGQTSTLGAPCHTYATPGTYSVHLDVTANKCSNSITDTNAIRIIAGPVARFAPSATIIQQPESEVSFYNHSYNSSTYSWNFGGAGTSTDNSPSFNFTQYGRYNVMLVAQDTLGCLDTTEVPITVLPSQNFYIPNVFTPNGDGHNDGFYVEMQEGVTVIDFTVFDRWGEKVHDGQYPWDGTFKGKPCPQGVYVYVFKLQLAANAEGIKRTGAVTLFR